MKSTAAGKQAAFGGDLADTESLVALKDLMSALGSKNVECRVDGGRFDVSERAGYIFNSTIAGIDQADAIILVGVNPRHEAAVLNERCTVT